MSFRIALAILSGFMVSFSFPKWNLWFLAWGALVPMLWAIEGLDFKKSFFIGWLTGTVAFCGILYWIVPTFQAAGVSTTVGILSTFLLAGYIGIYYGLFSIISEKFFKSFSAYTYILLCSSFWVSLEFLRGHLFTGFPWGILGYSQWKGFSLLQISKWTGVYGVSFFLVFMNTHLLYADRHRKATPTLSDNIAKVIVIIFIFLFLFSTFPTANGRSFSISILQGNIDQYKKWSPEYVKEILDSYRSLSEKASPLTPQSLNHPITQSPHHLPANQRSAFPSDRQVVGSPHLIIWPETAVPGWVPQDKWLMEWIEKSVKKTGCYNLLGAVTQDGNKNYNSAFLFDPDGKIVGRYDKMHLVPFGEFVPLQSILGKWIPVLNQLGGFDSGKKQEILETPKGKLGVSICYEAIFPELIRKQVQAGAEVLVNITNDGWYLDTAAPEQHFAMNVFRAIENRRVFVRAANTGISGIIDPNGRVKKKSRLNEQTLLSGEIEPIQKQTFYTKYGDLFAILCSCVSLMSIFTALICKKMEIKR